jgi:uncharacterized protein YlxW (UPF0749 family)
VEVNRWLRLDRIYLAIVENSLFKRIMIFCSVALILVLLAAACTPSASPEATRLSDLEAKVDTLTGLQTELTSLQGEVEGLSADQAEVAALQSSLDSLQTQMDGLAAEIDALGGVPETGQATAPEEHVEDPFAVGSSIHAGYHRLPRHGGDDRRDAAD